MRDLVEADAESVLLLLLVVSPLYEDCSATGPPPNTFLKTSPDFPLPSV